MTEHPPLLLDPPAGGEDEKEIVEDASLQHPNLHQLRHMNPERMLGQLTLFFLLLSWPRLVESVFTFFVIGVAGSTEYFKDRKTSFTNTEI